MKKNNILLFIVGLLTTIGLLGLPFFVGNGYDLEIVKEDYPQLILLSIPTIVIIYKIAKLK